MTITGWDLHARMAGLPGAALDHPFGPEVDVYKVGGKVFAILDGGGGRITLKCDPVLAEALREAHPAIRPGYHTDKRHWNTVSLDGSLADQLVCDLVDGSYDLVRASLPKKVQASLPPRGSAS